MSVSRTSSQICWPSRDSTWTSGRPGAARSPTSTMVLTTRAAKGALTTDSEATEEAARTAPSACSTAPGGLLVLHPGHVELELGGGVFGVERLVPLEVAFGEGEAGLGLGEGAGGLGELSVTRLRLDLDEGLTLGDGGAGADLDRHDRTHHAARNRGLADRLDGAPNLDGGGVRRRSPPRPG